VIHRAETGNFNLIKSNQLLNVLRTKVQNHQNGPENGQKPLKTPDQV